MNNISVFSYKTKLHLTDKFIKRLHIYYESPFISLWITPDNRVYLTSTQTSFKKYKHHVYLNCILKKEYWIIDGIFPFPWENNYKFIPIKKDIFILQNNTTKKECISNVFPKPKTLSTTRRRKITPLQNLCNIEPTKDRENPDIIDTLL